KTAEAPAPLRAAMTSRFCRSTAAGQPAHQTATVVPAGCRMSAGAERSEPENAITDLSERFDRARFSATSFAASKSVKWARIVPSDLGRGCTLNVISQIVPTVPSAPMWSLLRSYPTTFFTTLPPLRTRWPFGSATWTFWAGISRPTALGVQVKLASLPSRIGELVAVSSDLASQASDAEADWIVYAGVGIARLAFTGGSVDLIRRIRDATALRGGTCVVESADGVPIDPVLAWGPVRDDFALMKRVKAQFDPKRTLNPGRFVGGI
ncbi:MAG: hypothetical protein EB020_10360, partial [Proteobacteria bacterium]|nr:hypothetical protein [Pseudomonadota bacterium]